MENEDRDGEVLLLEYVRGMNRPKRNRGQDSVDDRYPMSEVQRPLPNRKCPHLSFTSTIKSGRFGLASFPDDKA